MAVTRAEAIYRLMQIGGEAIIIFCIILIIAGVMFIYTHHKIEKEYREAVKEIKDRYGITSK